MAPGKKASAKKAPKGKKAAEAVEETPVAKELPAPSAGCQKILDDIDEVLGTMDDVLKAFVIHINTHEDDACLPDDPHHIELGLGKIRNKASAQVTCLQKMVEALNE